MVSLIEAFGFRLDRFNSSHHIFKHPDIIGIVNIQNREGKVQPYQIR
ncbi:MAG: type II toxin-antitoxin system HicA family toxin [Cyanobacteria bacterium P01_F01_bin.143]